MLQPNVPLFDEIVRAAHDRDPAASRRYRPFDVGRRPTVANSFGGTRPAGAAVAGLIAAATARLARLRPTRPSPIPLTSPDGQPACC